MAYGEAEALADRRAPAHAALAIWVTHPGGVPAEPPDLPVDVRRVRVDRHVLADALGTPVRQRTADHRVAEHAGTDERVADAARAVIAGVEQSPVAAAPLVGLADDRVCRADDRADRRRCAL